MNVVPASSSDKVDARRTPTIAVQSTTPRVMHEAGSDNGWLIPVAVQATMPVVPFSAVGVDMGGTIPGAVQPLLQVAVPNDTGRAGVVAQHLWGMDVVRVVTLMSVPHAACIRVTKRGANIRHSAPRQSPDDGSPVRIGGKDMTLSLAELTVVIPCPECAASS